MAEGGIPVPEDVILLRIIVAVVGLHTAIGLVHSLAHVTLGIVPPMADLAFIVIVIFAAPIVAAALRWRGPRQVADAILAASFAAAFAYGVAFHLVLPGPDNFASLPASAWSSVFIAAGLGLTITEAVGVGIACADFLGAPKTIVPAPVSRLEDTAGGPSKYASPKEVKEGLDRERGERD